MAGGDYQDGDRHRQGFVAVEGNGVWGQAIEVPGLGALARRRAAARARHGQARSSPR